MTAHKLAVAVLVTVEHEHGPEVPDVVVLDEVGRQVLGLGPIVCAAPVGGYGVYVVTDATAEPTE